MNRERLNREIYIRERDKLVSKDGNIAHKQARDLVVSMMSETEKQKRAQYWALRRQFGRESQCHGEQISEKLEEWADFCEPEGAEIDRKYGENVDRVRASLLSD